MQKFSDIRAALLNEGLWTGGQIDLYGQCLFEPGARLYHQVRIVNCQLGAYSYVNANSSLSNVKVGRYCSIASEVLLGLDRHPTDWVSTSPFPFDNVGHPPLWQRFEPTHRFSGSSPLITIEDDVWIGARVIVAGARPITIGRGSIIAAGSVVTKNIPPYSIVGGNPARYIRARFSAELIAKIQATRWWDFDVYRFSSEHLSEVLPWDKPDDFVEYWECKGKAAFADYALPGELKKVWKDSAGNWIFGR